MVENPRDFLIACSRGSYEDGEDSSDSGSVTSSTSMPLPSNRNGSVMERESAPSQSLLRGSYPRRIQDIPWYHRGMTRNSAEAILLTNGVEGSYLLRESSSNPGQYTISVRYLCSVKHFALTYDGECYNFGIAQFDSLEDLLDHFSCLPIIGGETGGTITLKYPYHHEIPEPHNYEKIERHAEGGRFLLPKERSNSLPDYHIASMEGFLVKQGAVRKSWRKRWFVLRKNELKYYKRRDSTKPIRIINLENAMVAQEEEIPGKIHCFFLQLPWRTFHFFASTSKEAGDWIRILQWKVNYYKMRSNSKLSKDPLASMAR